MTPTVNIGCQTYTWQMSEGRFDGRLDHIVNVVAAAGFAGVEPETRFLGALADPVRLAAALQENGLGLPALTLVEDWRGADETADEKQRADACLALLEYFPGTLLNLCQMPGLDRGDLVERQRNALRCVNAVGARARDRGIVAGFHPNSPAGSVFRDAEDYQVMLDGLDDRFVGYIPDSGHIAKGGMDPLTVIRNAFPRVCHVHFKDMFSDGRWAPLGAGSIDHVAITTFLAAQGYTGWIVVEDECAAAESDPDRVALADGGYVAEVLRPLLNPSPV